MDAFSVSLADGLSDSGMGGGRMLKIAGTFAIFQFAMPMTGWFLVRTAVEKFGILEKFVPWIALILLLYIGGKMLIEGIKENQCAESGKTEAGKTEAGKTEAGKTEAGKTEAGKTEVSKTEDGGKTEAAKSDGSESGGEDKALLSGGELVLQGIATSIDALSVGFTIEEYALTAAFGSSAIIGVVTLFICLAGLRLGRSLGTRLAGKASMFGGGILIFIGIEIWLRGIM